EVANQIALLRNREQIVTRQMDEVIQKNKEVPTLELGLQRLQRDAKNSEDLLALLRTKHQEAQIKEAERIEEVSIVRPATDPIEPRPALARVEPEVLQSHALLITHFDPKSPVAEAYRTLRTNLQFIRMERAGKVLVFTSPTLQEGKTTTIVNVALTMAQNGQRTLLIGANMRRPSIYRFFGIEREP